MLSHLRFHRRGASTPSSPVPEQQQSLSPISSNESPQALESASSLDASSTSDGSSHTPKLPPIARVVPSEPDSRCERRNTAGPALEARPQQTQRMPSNGDAGFIGGAALKNYRRDVQAPEVPPPRIDTVDRASNSHLKDNPRNQKHNQQEAAAESAPISQIKKTISFSAPTDFQGSQSSNLGRRPPGARLPPESLMSPYHTPSTPSVEPQRGKKGLPFLKNPMSTLLMRRRNNQNAPDLRPLPLKQKDEEPAYDPRIKGTRVHDFSAPRKSREANRTNSSAPQVLADTKFATGQQTRPASSLDAEEVSSKEQKDAAQSLNVSVQSQSPRTVNDASRNTSRSHVSSSSDQECHGDIDATMESSPEEEKDETGALPGRDVSFKAGHEKIETRTAVSSSTRTSRSRNISLSEMSISAVPRHMKSTSSRFSFDMTGAPKQEKLLEERHRQRELERKTADDDNNRDSRFYDFDDGAFGYDAMIDDDGLEEKIPGVNADLDDTESPGCCGIDIDADPDNDQENFAGFVFQRSNPVSALESPPPCSDLIKTPRDADGNVIGFAISKDTPWTPSFPTPTQVHDLNDIDGREEIACESGIHSSTINPLSQSHSGDDLYYDDGVIGLEEDEFTKNDMAQPETKGQPFDESIFDDNDTDQFGRPVPRAFQHAQSLRRATQQRALKRESDLTSRLSAPSGISCSTTQTSLSADDTVHESQHALGKESDDKSPLQDAEALIDGARSVAAYQAALAAAACRAAATGKFQRSSSPSSASIHIEDDDVPAFSDDEDIHVYDDLDDDFDLGDDAIIAEANASALANDSDGWYGQEFGFYSAPPSANATSLASGASSLKDYEYANGGFFGPQGTRGLNRSTSGRMISREPNLTPITERSEYSNRNSLMSLGYPPVSTSSPILQSPGLAQLAMMTDSRDDQMTLSSLLRLRSKAWGGSQASLASSRDGSPRSERGDFNNPSWFANPPGVGGGPMSLTHSRKPSTSLAMSHDGGSDDASASGSPTMTMAAAGGDDWQKLSWAKENPIHGLAEGGGMEVFEFSQELDSTADDMVSTADEFSPMKRSRPSPSPMTTRSEGESLSSSSGRPVSCHRPKGSADSVSYIKEERSGETRWVLERRRTAESGEVEVLDREVIEGRKI